MCACLQTSRGVVLMAPKSRSVLQHSDRGRLCSEYHPMRSHARVLPDVRCIFRSGRSAFVGFGPELNFGWFIALHSRKRWRTSKKELSFRNLGSPFDHCAPLIVDDKASFFHASNCDRKTSPFRSSMKCARALKPLRPASDVHRALRAGTTMPSSIGAMRDKSWPLFDAISATVRSSSTAMNACVAV
jgi:hypothetical protein